MLQPVGGMDAVVRAFVRLRELLGNHADLARRLDELEDRYDGQFKAVFDVIRELWTLPLSLRTAASDSTPIRCGDSMGARYPEPFG